MSKICVFGCRGEIMVGRVYVVELELLCLVSQVV